MLSLISEGFLVLFGNEVGFFLPFLQNDFASYQLVCISQTVCSIYVVGIKHDSIQNSIREAFCQGTLFSLNDRCCICMKSFFFNYIYSVSIIIIFGCILESIIKNTYINKRIIDPLFKSRGFVKDRKNEDRLKALDSKIDQKVEDVKNKVGAVMDIVDQVKKLLDKINKK